MQFNGIRWFTNISASRRRIEYYTFTISCERKCWVEFRSERIGCTAEDELTAIQSAKSEFLLDAKPVIIFLSNNNAYLDKKKETTRYPRFHATISTVQWCDHDANQDCNHCSHSNLLPQNKHANHIVISAAAKFAETTTTTEASFTNDIPHQPTGPSKRNDQGKVTNNIQSEWQDASNYKNNNWCFL